MIVTVKVLSGIVSASSNVPLFVLTKMFPSLLQSLSPPGTYWLLASIALSSNIFYYFVMRETRSKIYMSDDNNKKFYLEKHRRKKKININL